MRKLDVRAGCFSILQSKRDKLRSYVVKVLSQPLDVHKRDLRKVAGMI